MKIREMSLGRRLGLYLVAAGLCELAMMPLAKGSMLQPRIGWSDAILPRLGAESASVAVWTELSSAVYSISMGTSFILGLRPLLTYLAIEFFLLAPTVFVGILLLFVTGWGMAGLGILGVAAVFDGIPCYLAVKALIETK